MEKYLLLNTERFVTDFSNDYIDLAAQIDSIGIKQEYVDSAKEDLDEAQNWIHLGADCCKWLYDELLKNGYSNDCAPLMESWGWYFAIKNEQTKFSFGIYFRGDGDQNHWIIKISKTPKAFSFFKKNKQDVFDLLVQRADQILSSSPKLISYTWYNINPWEIKKEELKMN